MIRKILTLFTLVIVILFFEPIQMKAKAQNYNTIPCSGLSGSGTFSDPLIIGTVTSTVVISNCPRLTSGSPYNHRYFSFSLSEDASSNSLVAAGVNLAPGEISAVHPRLALPSGWTLLTSVHDGHWYGNPDKMGVVWRYLGMQGFSSGTYILGVEKLDSPLRSTQTPNFWLEIIP